MGFSRQIRIIKYVIKAVLKDRASTQFSGEWIAMTVDLLQENKFTEVDLDHLIEEITAMAKNEKHALESNLEVVLMHLLKYKYQPPRRSRSWLLTLREHRLRLHRSLRDSPSLRPYLLQVLSACYSNARKLADETGLSLAKFPELPIFTPEQVLDEDFLPD